MLKASIFNPWTRWTWSQIGWDTNGSSSPSGQMELLLSVVVDDDSIHGRWCESKRERERERERHCCALRFAKPRFDRVFRHYAVQLLPSFLPSPLRSIDHSSPWLTSDIVKGFKTPFEMRAMRQMILLNITPAMRSLILPARSFVHILFSRKRDEIYLPL